MSEVFAVARVKDIMHEEHVTRTPKSACEHCGQVLDAASAFFGNDRPKKGDCSMCLYCGTIHVFTKGLRLRRMTFAEIDALDPKLRELLARMQRTRPRSIA